jgi:hypothetical protein
MENRTTWNKSKIEVIKATKFPDVLVVTPLLPGDKISKETKKTIKRNTLKYFWITSEGKNNIPINALQGIKWAKKHVRFFPKYYIMIDRDIILGRSMLDRLFKSLEKSPDNIGYAYAGFEFKGAVNQKFPAIPFDPSKLLQSNYISSNSMFKMKVINEVGLVVDNKYRRLLDWAFLLKCLNSGYHGINVENARFIAKSEPGSISAGSKEDYEIKYRRVFEDFVKPIIQKLNQ